MSPTGRPDAGTKNILPDEIGLDNHGRNEPWDVQEVKRRGLAAAQSAGISNPTPDEIVRRALYEAARLNPLKSSEAETRGLLQLAFYSLGPELGKVDADAVRYCAEQVKASLKDHLQDTREQFDSWIGDSKANLIKRISKRKGCAWNKLDVRRALLELGC